jgi:D-alanyl-D-alanine endopeptidase (penicillin-binding protein 7)
VRLDHVRADNPLAVYQLSATIGGLSDRTYGLNHLHRTARFWIGQIALCSFVCVSAPLLAQVQQETRPAANTKPAAAPKSSTAQPASAAKRTPLYVRPDAPATSLTRQATAARSRNLTAEMSDTTVPRYKVDAAGDLVPDLRAAAAIIYDPITNHVLWEENSQAPRSIASITKVMTATVFLENNPDLSQVVTIQRSDVFQASTTFIRQNDRVTADDLMHLLLIASDNAAARALARVSPQGSSGFIDRMNARAAELGLESTHYADPSGLLSDNVSSAYDMAKLITHASADDKISSIMRLQEYTVHAARRDITFRSTDHLLGHEGMDVLAAKTGFISKAGYCLATLLRLPQSGQQVAVVVLGARSNAGRFMETQNLFAWLSSRATTIFATATQPPLAVLAGKQQ